MGVAIQCLNDSNAHQVLEECPVGFTVYKYLDDKKYCYNATQFRADHTGYPIPYNDIGSISFGEGYICSLGDKVKSRGWGTEAEGGGSNIAPRCTSKTQSIMPHDTVHFLTH